MPAGSIFDSESERRGPNIKIVAIRLVALIVLCSAGTAIYFYTKPVPQTSEEARAEEIRNTTVLMLAQPTFSGEDFRQQVLGKGRLVKFVRSLKDAYFIFPANSDEEFQQFVGKYFVDPTKLEFAKSENGEDELGGYKIPDENGVKFFRTSLENIHIEPNQQLSFKLADATYDVSLNELRNLANSSELYGGKLIARTPSHRDGPQFVFANHGIMVAKPGEPSLKRLVDELLKVYGKVE
jgi:hypothetical protein